MKSLFCHFIAPDELVNFPTASPWYFQWGLPGIRTVLSYRKLIKAMEADESGDSAAVAEALENFGADKFACKYGRRGNARLRALIEEAQKRSIASEDEMRTLVRYGDIRAISDDEIRIRVPTYSAIGAGMFLFVTTTYFLLMLLLLVVVAPGGLLTNLPEFVLVTLLYAGWSLPSYTGVIRPFEVIRRIRSSLKSLDSQLSIIASPIKPYAIK